MVAARGLVVVVPGSGLTGASRTSEATHHVYNQAVKYKITHVVLELSKCT